jgi:iron(III) transport system ATP-binding protein
VVLLDELFSGLDAALRDEVRGTTRQRFKGAGGRHHWVTHDPDEAMRVGDRADARPTAGADWHARRDSTGTPPIRRQPPYSAAPVSFHARVTKGCVASPFGQTPTKSVAEGAPGEVLSRSASVRVAGKGVPARVLTVRPYAGQLEVEVAILGSALPEGVEVPIYARAAAAMSTALTPGANIQLAGAPEDAFVFPCRDEICRSRAIGLNRARN